MGTKPLKNTGPDITKPRLLNIIETPTINILDNTNSNRRLVTNKISG